MRIDPDQVRHVAHLARLTVSDEEVARFAGQLSAILEYVEQLNELDTRNVPPTAHALPVHNVLRDDVARPSLTPDQGLANAPQREGDYFALPKVLEQDNP
jgi:aspartyl-tRNA(Asn)/glutamyl-tRNA(Gln) amidotransferase subunit C